MKKFSLLACILLVSVTSAYAQFLFTSIVCPGGQGTTARGINNNGEIVGRHAGHAVLIKGGQCIQLAPTTVLGADFSEAFKNNNKGDAVGEFVDNNGFAHGFLLTKSGTLTTLDFPGASDTIAFGVNQSDTVVGEWDLLDSGGNLIVAHGFTWVNGSFSQVDFPGSGDSSVNGIDDAGDLVGEWDTGPTATVGHGFIFSKGKFTSFDVPVPGSTLSQGNDINSPSLYIGIYLDGGGNEHGFLQSGATFTNIDFPATTLTSTWGINNSSQIVGNHFDLNAPVAGYLAFPMGAQAMEGDLKVKPGDTLSAGYDFTMPGTHPTATVQFLHTMITFQAQCVSGTGGGAIVIALADSTYTDPANSSQWLPSGDQHSPLVYQGSTAVPDLCAGGQMTLKKGGTFGGQVQSSDITDKINFRWHYSANGSAGGWSGTFSFIPF